MSRRNTSFMYILLALVLCLTQLPSTMFAASATTSPNNSTTSVDAVLVLDASNSMKSSDPQQLGSEAMKLFIDMLPSQGDRVGIVSYTDRIEREKALTAIQSADDKTELKSFIDGLTRGAYTDISVGMKEAVTILQDNAQQGHEPMIVLFSDGNNQLNSNSGRSNSQADTDLNTAVEQAKKDGYPV